MKPAVFSAAVLAACIDEAQPATGLLDLALEYGDSRVTHQRRFRTEPTRDTVADLLSLDGNNPRSIQVTLREQTCNDTMVDALYSFSATVEVDGRALAGCAVEGGARP